MKSETADNVLSFFVGNRVRIRRSCRSPYSGRWGVLSSVDVRDDRAPYLVSFDDGTQYRYTADEVELARTQPRNGLLDRILGRDSQARTTSPNHTQPSINPSVPSRFGTRQ
ncbi:MAG TPA: hypothetical protein VGK48_04065 [Terriglobia bacterium]